MELEAKIITYNQQGYKEEPVEAEYREGYIMIPSRKEAYFFNPRHLNQERILTYNLTSPIPLIPTPKITNTPVEHKFLVVKIDQKP